MNKDDRQLLELAAMAIGFRVHYDQGERGIAIVKEGTREAIEYWNPLANDGDALLLVVILNLSTIFTKDSTDSVVGVRLEQTLEKGDCPAAQFPFRYCQQCVNPCQLPRSVNTDELFMNHSSKEAATRRAIVRAAAQIELDKRKKTAA